MGNKTENCGCVNFGKGSRKSDGSMIQLDDKDSRGARNSQYSTAVLAAAFAIQSIEEKEARTGTPSQDKKYGNGNIINRKQGNASATDGKPSPYIIRSTSTTFLDAPVKVERHGNLKSVLSWANEKKRKAIHKMEKTKSELMEPKVAKRSASSSKTD